MPALDPAAAQVVVDAVEPGCLVSDCNSKLFDFGSASSADLENITIPLRLQAGAPRARACAVMDTSAGID